MDERSSVALVAALASAWAAIRTRHPEVPGVIVIPAPHGKKNGVLGHFAPLRWQPMAATGAMTHEVVVVAEYLDRGAREVFETLLHEAAHALNCARGVRDCSANQYHNRAFERTAIELGLTVTQVPHYGFAYTQLPKETEARYGAVIDALASVLITRSGRGEVILPPPTGTTPANTGSADADEAPSSSRLRKAVCACPFIIRASRKTLAETIIRCENCGETFQLA